MRSLGAWSLEGLLESQIVAAAHSLLGPLSQKEGFPWRPRKLAAEAAGQEGRCRVKLGGAHTEGSPGTETEKTGEWGRTASDIKPRVGRGWGKLSSERMSLQGRGLSLVGWGCGAVRTYQAPSPRALLSSSPHLLKALDVGLSSLQ